MSHIHTELTRFDELRLGDRIWNAVTELDYEASPEVVKLELFESGSIAYTVDTHGATKLATPWGHGYPDALTSVLRITEVPEDDGYYGPPVGSPEWWELRRG